MVKTMAATRRLRAGKRWPGITRIREAVFIQEQVFPLELEWDEFDANCIHILAVDSAGNPVGTATVVTDGSIGRMAVLGNGAGGAWVAGCFSSC